MKNKTAYAKKVVYNASSYAQSFPETRIANPRTYLVHEKLLSFTNYMITITKQEYIQLLREAKYWKTQDKLVCEREEALKEVLKQQETIICDLNQRIYEKESKKNQRINLK